MKILNKLQEDAAKYDIDSLILLKNKRLENIALFEQSIKNERAISQQEESAQSALQIKLNNHDLGIAKLSDADREWILTDIPKLKSTRENREKTITLLKTAILEEYSSMDYESQMISWLENKNGSKI
jgi:hypothetical protein